ncbi:hypothetical protein Tco_1506005 [Tanacetum coccineum]
MFSGKLKSRWSRPFTIAHVFPYGIVELSQDSGPNFKVKLSDPKQALRGRHPMRLSWIFEASRARGFCPSFTRASHPQLHLGNLIS